MKLRPVQYWMASKAIELKRVYFGAEMGFGKTAACLKAIEWLDIESSLIGKVLVIAPYAVALNTWPDEINQWSEFSYSVIMGTPEERERALGNQAKIHIINPHNFVWLYRYWVKRKRWPYQMLIFDEASRIGSGKKRTPKVKLKSGRVTGQRMSVFGALARMVNKFEYVILLSGTPAARGVLRLWGPMYLIDGGERLGNAQTSFLERYSEKNTYTFKVEVKDFAEEEILEKVKDRLFILKAEDYGIKLPNISAPLDKYVTLPSRILQMYRRFEKESYLKEHDIDALNAGVLINKLLQFANGHVYDDEKKVHKIHDEKFKMLDSVIEDAFEHNILCAYSFKFDEQELRKRYRTARFFGDTKNDVKDWNEGKLQILFCQPGQMAHGLNLQRGGCYAVWFGLTWDLELYQQFLARLARPGSVYDNVRVVRILARGTEDETQAERLIEKGMTQDRIENAVRFKWNSWRT